MFYGPDSYYGHEVSILEMDGRFENLDEMIYVEGHLSNTYTKYYGELTHLLREHQDYPGAKDGSGLFQLLVGLQMRSVYDQIMAGETKVPAKV
jgi:phosphoribulokinase